MSTDWKIIRKYYLHWEDILKVTFHHKVSAEDGNPYQILWENRKNYYKSKDLDLLTIANTVTGAASVFRASMLEKTLPFPPRYGNVFHDQWIAIIAAASGGIEYVDAV